MIKKYNNISLAVGIPGLVVQIAGRIWEMDALTLTGTVILLVGFYYYTKAKGRNPAWCLMAFLSIIGLLVLAMLKDMAKEEVAENEEKET